MLFHCTSFVVFPFFNLYWNPHLKKKLSINENKKKLKKGMAD